MKLHRLILVAGLLLFSALPSFAQNTQIVALCGSGLSGWAAGDRSRPLIMDTNGNLCSSVSVSASISPFTPSAAGARATPLAVTTSDSSGTLPTGASVVVGNVGSNPMYCNTNGIAATTSDQLITPSGGWFEFGIPAAITTLHCIATGSSTTANMVGGSGLGAGTGGGGGSGGTVNQGTAGASAWLVTGTGGTFPATQSGTWNLTNISGTISLPTGASTSALQTTGNTSLASIATNTGGVAQGSTTSGQTLAPIGITRYDGTTVMPVGDPCQTGTKVFTSDASQTANTKWVSATANKKIYICEIFLFSTAGETVSVVEGTGSNCATGTHALYGSATVANGIGLSANGGFARGNGYAAVQATPDTNNDLCVWQNGSNRVNISLATVTQ